MTGKSKGVQALISHESLRVFFMPSGCHSLNLVVGDVADSSREAVSFFGTIERIYILFSASVGSWKILKFTAK
jgi:hypothetical protein